MEVHRSILGVHRSTLKFTRYTEVNLFHNECSDAMFFCSHVSFSIDNEDISVWSVSDPELTAIENIVVT